MLTLRDVKQLMETPEGKTSMPSAKCLKDSGNVLLSKRIGKGTKLTVYREGYAVYEIGKNATVFLVSDCGDYEYGEALIHEEYFDGLAWYVRLLLEGEDRLFLNRELFERKKSISYSAVSEEWGVLGDTGESVLERLIREETLEKYLGLLTERQYLIICRFYFQKKTQRRRGIWHYPSRRAAYKGTGNPAHAEKTQDSRKKQPQRERSGS